MLSNSRLFRHLSLSAPSYLKKIFSCHCTYKISQLLVLVYCWFFVFSILCNLPMSISVIFIFIFLLKTPVAKSSVFFFWYPEKNFVWNIVLTYLSPFLTYKLKTKFKDVTTFFKSFIIFSFSFLFNPNSSTLTKSLMDCFRYFPPSMWKALLGNAKSFAFSFTSFSKCFKRFINAVFRFQALCKYIFQWRDTRHDALEYSSQSCLGSFTTSEQLPESLF